MKLFGSLVAGAALLALGSAAHAQDFQPETKGTWMVNVRASDVAPDTNDKIKTAAGVDSGLHVHVSDSVMPTLGFSYFLTDHIAVEAILGTTQHSIYARGGDTNVKVRKTWVLPPVISLQYHPLPAARISPYVGGGINAMIFYAGDNKNDFDVHLKDGIGWAVQGGTDIALKGPWSLNLDVKKVFFNTHAKINDGALKSSVDLDPWVFSLGVGRKF